MATKKTNRKKISLASIGKEIKAPALIILGVSGGVQAGKLLDKALKMDEAEEGFQIKKLIKPVVQIAAGLGGAVLLKDENLKLISSGVAASGIASTVQVFLKKSLLNGFGDAGVGRIFRDNPINLSIGPYNPDLPQLNQTEYMQVQGPESDLSDYEQVGEVTIL